MTDASGVSDTFRTSGASDALRASVSTHVLDTGVGRPARGVAVELLVRSGGGARWRPHTVSRTDDDGRCKDFPPLPEGTTQARLRFDVGPYLDARRKPGARRDGDEDRYAEERPEPSPGAAEGAAGEPPPAAGGEPFFPEVTVAFAVRPGEHHHVPLLLSPFGYSVYRGS